ncbi:MAG: carbamoyltransferase HypF [Desulfatitalea sp.]|nr:carbamoyltransferase HypF [Desulfatitalea sp.]NNK02040.1 carbamoyltransferase HypF [Desulfatitalea sp.]
MHTPHQPITARQADISGIVQGVGFRPYVYRLAGRYGLLGRVRNTAAGVTIWAEGPADRLDAFFLDLPRLQPPLARIVSMHITQQPAAGHTCFDIAASQSTDKRSALIVPDVAVCEDCLREMRDPEDRRYQYPFINCTNCGPRYTIIEDIPYDRPKTAMRRFTLCEQCRAEYDNPHDRRYHAQPNACARCGPQAALLDVRRQPVVGNDANAKAARLIRDGSIVALKGLGGFHLAVNAHDDAAVVRLRRRKHRAEKPLAIMAADIDTVATFARLTPEHACLLQSHQRPIVLLPKQMPERLAASISPDNSHYGVMLPYTPLHHLLLDCGLRSVVMTSANLSEEPLVIDNEEAFARLAGIADYFLIHDRPIYLRNDDSIVRQTGGTTRMIRRSRGFAPLPIFLADKYPAVLACGGALKNTICLLEGRQAFISQHIGDLENPAAEDFFRLTIGHLKRILNIAPRAIACDPHPDYLSTRWATGQKDLPLIHVQHHHAHIASCMAEHRLKGEVIGLAFDGTGLGPDGTVWGGEALLADLSRYRRIGHLAYVPMPGGAEAIKAPWRMGLAWLIQVFGERIWELELPFLQALNPDQARTIAQMVVRRINAPLTSSMGRLFDAVAAIIGLRSRVCFEGQAAMALEMIAAPRPQGIYPFCWSQGPVHETDPAPIISAIVADIAQGTPAPVISRRFHDTLITMWTSFCGKTRSLTGIERVVLSGGCFQNQMLLEGLTQALHEDGFKVFSHQQVPTNDGGLSLGQAIIAGARLSEGRIKS